MAWSLAAEMVLNLWRHKKKTTWPPSSRTWRHGLD